MTKVISKKLLYLLWSLPLLVFSCKDDDHSETPVYNYDLESFKEKTHGIISDSSFITGFVTANDASGNLSNKLYLQDATAAIRIFLAQDTDATSFGVGDEVKISTKGLYLYEYEDGAFELGAYDEERDDSVDAIDTYRGISSVEVLNKFQKTGADADHIKPYEILTTTVLHDSLISRVVKLKNAQFVELDQPYADAGEEVTKRAVEGPTGGMKYVFTSASASFATTMVPNGQGSIMGVLEKIGDNYGICIDAIEQVEMEDTRTDYDIFKMDDFAAVRYNDIEFAGWENVIEEGNSGWKGETGYVFASAYSGESKPNKFAWLISTEAIDLTGYTAPKVELMLRVTNHRLSTEPATYLEFYVSETYDPNAAFDKSIWGEPINVVKSSDLENRIWTPINRDLSEYVGKQIYIALRYVGSKPEGATATFDMNYITFYQED